jgi:hypothetical protein
MTRTSPPQRYDDTRDSLVGKSADGCVGHELHAPKPAAYWSAVRAQDRRRVPWRRRVWRWLLSRVWWWLQGTGDIRR